MKYYFVNIILAALDILTLSAIFYALPSKAPIILIILLLFYYEKIYTLHYDFWQETKKIFKALLLSYFIILSFLTLSNTTLQNQEYLISIYFLLAALLLPVEKRIAKQIIYSFAFFKQNVLLIGDAEEVKIFKKELQDNWYLGLQYNNKTYKSVIISSQNMKLEDVDNLVSHYLSTNASVHIVPYLRNINFSNANIMEYSNIRYNTIQIENKLLIQRNIVIKSLFDYILSLFVLPFFLLIHAVIALLIKLDSKGAVFFKQKRLAKDGQTFICYKYRTMYEDSDRLLQKYLQEHPQEVQYYNKYHKYKNDPRITKIGRFLRASSLDELAQIINVLKGDMSFIGPRPYMLNEETALGKTKEFILKVKPGITGLWQVSGRNNLTFKERNELDIWYIKNWSLWADFVILIKTIKVVLSKVGAK
ncbi:exopolysaccharide biosynthesis polyprenyl glycosylphosphotransferase [Sulfurimonas sp.]